MRAGEVVRAFDSLSTTPCPVCLELAQRGEIQPPAVMPLPKMCPPRHRDNRQCCRDCAATTLAISAGGAPDFESGRLTIANERVEGLRMPYGMMEKYGAHWNVAATAEEIAQAMIAGIDQKRELLGINTKKERVLMDMEMRRDLGGGALGDVGCHGPV